MRKLTTQEFIDRCYRVHGDKYDYSQTKYINSRSKVTIICKKHGAFRQKADDHRQGHGCPKCKAEKTGRFHRLGGIGYAPTDEFIKRAKSIHGNKFDYSQTRYINCEQKVTIICKKHGSFQQTPAEHYKGNGGCPECRRQEVGNQFRSTTETFIQKVQKIHGDRYSYHKSIYLGAIQGIIITCKIHGDFIQRPNDHLNGHGCPKCGLEFSATHRTLTTEQFIENAKAIHGNRYDYSQVRYRGKSKNVTVICPEHGPFRVSPNSHTSQKTGCPRCKCEFGSKGVVAISKILDLFNISYQREITFDNCRNQKVLRFDFCVRINGRIGLIEYDGAQHFIPVKWWGGKKGLDRIQRNDAIKNSYAVTNGFPLLRIPYTHKHRIKEILTLWLKSLKD